jgi:hypothetical protein
MATKKETTPASEKKTTVKKATTEPKTPTATAARKTKAAPAAEARVPAKAAKPAASGKASEKPSAALTRVLAYVDVGHGNTLFLRGEGPGLSWETGVPMQWIGDGCWSWSAESAGQDVTFKVLINDQHWSGGDNRTVAPGETASFTPTF